MTIFRMLDDPWAYAPRKGGGGGGQTTTTQETKSEPWAKQQPFLEYGFQQAQDIYKGQKPEYFPGQTVAGFNPYQTAALNMGGQRAMQGNPLLPAAQGQTMATIRGDYLAPNNPYINQLTQSINAAVRPQIDSRFSGSGRYGSAGMAEATSAGITNALAPQLFNQFNQERQNMLAATSAAPALAQADYNDINALGSVGLTQQQQAQNEINAQIERFNYGQNIDANKLAQYMGLIGGSYGGTSTGTSTSTGPSPGKGGNALGTAFQGIGALGNAAGGAAALRSAKLI